MGELRQAAVGLDDTSHRPSAGWRVVAAVEVCLVALVVVVDRIVPTLVILAMTGVSLIARRRSPASLGFRRHPRPGRMVAEVVGWTVLWTILLIGLVMPVLEHLTGQQQDVSQFAEVEGDLGLLLVLLALSWTLAAIGEETAYRGYVMTRVSDAVGPSQVAVLASVGVPAALFGLAHTEQGAIGVALTFMDAVVFAVLRLRYRTLWASVVAHGASNTIGLVAFYFVGPLQGMW
jgi:uncharacterized protein